MGRPRTKKARFPCGECAAETEGRSCLMCGVCNKWFHTECQHITNEDFEKWQNVDDDYLCQTCRCDGFGDTYDFLRGLSRLSKAANKGRNDLNAAFIVEKLLFEGSKTYSSELHINRCNNNQPCIDENAEIIRTRFTSELGVAVTSTPDGDCLFNAASTLLKGNETMSVELRYRTALMLHYETTTFNDHPNKQNISFISPKYEDAVKDCCLIGVPSSLWTIMGLARVIQKPIKVVYPSINGTKNMYYRTCNALFNSNSSEDTLTRQDFLDLTETMEYFYLLR